MPVLGQILQFVVVTRVAGSLRMENESRQEHTVLGIAEASLSKQTQTTGVLGFC